MKPAKDTAAAAPAAPQPSTATAGSSAPAFGAKPVKAPAVRAAIDCTKVPYPGKHL